VSEDEEICRLVAQKRAGQPAANLLFGAVHYLLLFDSAKDASLRDFYPHLTEHVKDAKNAYPVFRAFCLEHKAKIEALAASKLIQTNCLERCAVLLPAFQSAFPAASEVATLELGASSGLNLAWDKYRYIYINREGKEAFFWGEKDAKVTLKCRNFGRELDFLRPDFRNVWQCGIDLNPLNLMDVEALRWQKALVWAGSEHLEKRMQNLEEAAKCVSPGNVIQGDLFDLLPKYLEKAPKNVPLIVLASFVIYQLPEGSVERIYSILEAFSKRNQHRVALISLDSYKRENPTALIDIVEFDSSGTMTKRSFATAHPHGHMLKISTD
jgi:hypothetical protein